MIKEAVEGRIDSLISSREAMSNFESLIKFAADKGICRDGRYLSVKTLRHEWLNWPQDFINKFMLYILDSWDVIIDENVGDCPVDFFQDDEPLPACIAQYVLAKAGYLKPEVAERLEIVNKDYINSEGHKCFAQIAEFSRNSRTVKSYVFVYDISTEEDNDEYLKMYEYHTDANGNKKLAKLRRVYSNHFCRNDYYFEPEKRALLEDD